VDQKKALKVAAVGTVGYLAFRALQLRRAVQDLFIGVNKVEFKIDKASRQAIVTPVIEIVNPVGGSLTISNIYGNLIDNRGNEYGIFQSGRFLLTSSTTLVKLPVKLSSIGTILAVIDNIQNNKFPVLTLNYTIAIAGGLIPIKDKITFDTAVIKRAVDFT
jgi:hypothetical protein